MARPRKARVEGEEAASAIPDPVPGNNGEALSRIVEFFKAEFPEQWETLRLCPLQHGIEDMIGHLR